MIEATVVKPCATNPRSNRTYQLPSAYLVCLCTAFVILLPSEVQGADPSNHTSKPFVLLTVSEHDPWLLLSATAACAQIRSQGSIPLLLANPESPDRMIRDILPRVSYHLTIDSSDTSSSATAVSSHAQSVSISGANATEISMLIAETVWKQTSEVVLCPMDQHRTGLLGTSLATVLRCPFIPFDHQASIEDLASMLKQLQIERVYLCGLDRYSPLYETLRGSFNTVICDPGFIQEKLVRGLNPASIRNLVVMRAHDYFDGSGESSWIGPYLALMRNALPVCADSHDAVILEEKIWQVIRKYKLKPRTLTLLADYDTIGTIRVTGSHLAEYDVEVEACVYPGSHGASVLGVGRIPCRDLSKASALVVRGFIRPALLQNQAPWALMIANPNSEYGALPLAEAVSRATAQEFGNAGLHVDEFYGRPSHVEEIKVAASGAHMIVYEGHVSDQLLFQSSEYEDPIYFDGDTAWEGESDDAPYDPSSPDSSEETVHTATTHEPLPSPVMEQETDVYGKIFHGRISETRGMPLVILQSCHSLEESVAGRIFGLGGIGLIGSTTNIHSASGSSFIKATCDGLLYRNLTVGEALRDARNYFLCLAALKQQRGHSETAKVFRVALSFGLWGDPETVLFDSRVRPQRRPLQASFADPTTVDIKTSVNRLAQIKNNQYTARIMPGSSLAGIVKRLDNRPQRQLMPLYFFRLDRPVGFSDSFSRVYQEGEPSNRGVFMTDPWDRYVYLLYFPKKDMRNTTLSLSFGN